MFVLTDTQDHYMLQSCNIYSALETFATGFEYLQRVSNISNVFRVLKHGNIQNTLQMFQTRC